MNKPSQEDIRRLARYIKVVDVPVVDLLGDLACTPAEAERRRRARGLRNLFSQPTQLGISSRGIKKVAPDQ